jgi:hypothetical protein
VIFLLPTALAAQTQFPCAAPLASARRSSAPLRALLEMDESCRNSAWHDAVGVLLEAQGMLFSAQVHYGHCAASRDHLLDQCLAKLSRTAQATGEPSTLRLHLEGAGPELFRPEARDHLLLEAGRLALDEDDLRGGAHLLKQVRPGSPSHPQARSLRAQALTDLGLRGEAEEAWVEVLATAVAPWADRARLGLAQLALRRGEPEHARALLEPLGPRSSPWEAAQLLIARSYMAQGESVLALRMLPLRRLRGWEDQAPEGLLLRASASAQLCRGSSLRRTRRRLEELRVEHEASLRALPQADPRAAVESWASWELPSWLRRAVEDDDRARTGLQALGDLDEELLRAAELPDPALAAHLQGLLGQERRTQQEIVGRRLIWVLRSRSATVDAVLREAGRLPDAEGCP